MQPTAVAGTLGGPAVVVCPDMSEPVLSALPAGHVLLTLRHSEPVNLHLQRLHFHCPALASDEDDQADDNLLLVLAQADAQGQWPALERAPQRTYTVRARQHDNVVVDVYLHGDGLMAGWAANAQPGATLLARPLPRSGAYLRAADYPHHVLLGDDSALPLIGRWLERLPEGISAQAFIEVADANARQALAEDEDIAIQWLERNGFSASQSQLLEDALTDYVVSDAIMDIDAVFFVIAGQDARSARMAQFLIDAWAVAPDAIHHASHWQE